VAAFVAWKTVAWFDRRAPRELYDLWALAGRGAVTTRAAELFSAHGPTGGPPQPWMFASAPTESQWREQLANQTRLTVSVSAAEAMSVVAEAWAHPQGPARAGDGR
jgi:hypothetical protein